MRIERVVVILIIMSLSVSLYAEGDLKEQQKKDGWGFAGLPIIAFDSDIGFKYGLFGSFSYYGEGRESVFPDYKHYIYFEYARTSREGGIQQVYYRGHNLWGSSLNMTMDLSRLREERMDFYGFNGVETDYDERKMMAGTNEFVSAAYYRYKRRLVRFYCYLDRQIGQSKFSWYGGFAYHDIEVNSPVGAEGKSLYDEYVEAGAISREEARGGMVNIWRLGLMYDTRSRRQNPMRGQWSEVLWIQAVPWGGGASFTKLSATHRQYFTLIPQSLSLALRLSCQATIKGSTPFYYLSFLHTSNNGTELLEGFGGMRSGRGILRNRFVGEGLIYGTTSLRWRFYGFKWKKNMVDMYLNTFSDLGRVMQKVDYNREGLGIVEQNDPFHVSVGQGLYFSLNSNFVLFVSYARGLRRQDRIDGLYFSTSWMF